jgi:Pyruvate/2-oxoacid:ferredoxin oxidoreductase delta subunit
MTIFYFTATGNSLAVAKRLGGKLISIPQVVDSPEIHYKDDCLGVVFPVYGLTLPRMVRLFLDKVTLEADYIFAIGTYGNMAGPCMYNLQKQAIKSGYRFDYVNQIPMVDNFLPVFEMGSEVAKLPIKKVEKTIGEIIGDIQNRKHIQATSSLGMRALASVLASLGSTDKNAQKYLVNDQCTKCGTCAKVCPIKNISVSDKVYFSAHCEGCLACVHLCPQNAIHLKNEKSGKRWRNLEISLAEIINANNRYNN